MPRPSNVDIEDAARRIVEEVKKKLDDGARFATVRNMNTASKIDGEESIKSMFSIGDERAKQIHSLAVRELKEEGFVEFRASIGKQIMFCKPGHEEAARADEIRSTHEKYVEIVAAKPPQVKKPSCFPAKTEPSRASGQGAKQEDVRQAHGGNLAEVEVVKARREKKGKKESKQKRERKEKKQNKSDRDETKKHRKEEKRRRRKERRRRKKERRRKRKEKKKRKRAAKLAGRQVKPVEPKVKRRRKESLSSESSSDDSSLSSCSSSFSSSRSISSQSASSDSSGSRSAAGAAPSHQPLQAKVKQEQPALSAATCKDLARGGSGPSEPAEEALASDAQVPPAGSRPPAAFPASSSRGDAVDAVAPASVQINAKAPFRILRPPTLSGVPKAAKAKAPQPAKPTTAGPAAPARGHELAPKAPPSTLQPAAGALKVDKADTGHELAPAQKKVAPSVPPSTLQPAAGVPKAAKAQAPWPDKPMPAGPAAPAGGHDPASAQEKAPGVPKAVKAKAPQPAKPTTAGPTAPARGHDLAIKIEASPVRSWPVAAISPQEDGVVVIEEEMPDAAADNGSQPGVAQASGDGPPAAPTTGHQDAQNSMGSSKPSDPGSHSLARTGDEVYIPSHAEFKAATRGARKTPRSEARKCLDPGSEVDETIEQLQMISEYLAMKPS